MHHSHEKLAAELIEARSQTPPIRWKILEWRYGMTKEWLSELKRRAVNKVGRRRYVRKRS